MHLDVNQSNMMRAQMVKLFYWCNIQNETWVEGLTGMDGWEGRCVWCQEWGTQDPMEFLDDSDHSIICDAKEGQSMRETFLHYWSLGKMQEEW